MTRATLTVRRPEIEKLLHDCPVQPDNLDPLRRWGATIFAARNRWDINRRQLPRDAAGWVRGGFLAGKGKLSRSDADSLLRRAFADLSEKEAAQ